MGPISQSPKITGSGGIFLPSSSEVSGDPCRKEATVGFSSGSSSKLEPPPLAPFSPSGALGMVDWLGVASSVNLTWQCLFLCPSQLGLQWSLLLDLALDFKRALVQLSQLISSSIVATAAKAF